jgi:hypothetical protein
VLSVIVYTSRDERDRERPPARHRPDPGTAGADAIVGGVVTRSRRDAPRTSARIGEGETMAKFSPLDPKAVVLGRGIAARQARQPYLEALRKADAGRIEIERGEKPGSVKRLLQESAKELGVRVRSSWADGKQQTLFWKKTRSR